MKLYYFPQSSNVRKVQAIALHLNLSLELVLVNLPQGEQHQPEFLAMNPTGRIPVLQDGDFVLWESNAIMQYLASQVPTSLWPQDAKLQADISRWQCWQLAHWSQGCQPINFERVVKPALQLGEPDAEVIDQALLTFHREAGMLNHHLSQHDYLVNDQLTLADFSVASELTYAVMAELPLERYSAIQAWLVRLNALSAWQQTVPQLMAR